MKCTKCDYPVRKIGEYGGLIIVKCDHCLLTEIVTRVVECPRSGCGN